jgi:hypothetical protein
MRNAPLAFGSAVVVLLVAVLALAGMAARVANAQPATDMGIDTLVAGNANATVGTVDQCAQINEDDTINADEATNVDLDGDTTPDPDILLVDVFVRGVPAYSDNGTPADPTDDTGGIIGFQYDLQYPSASLTVVAQSLQSGNPFAPVTSLIAVNAGSSPFEVSSAVPDDNADDSWQGSALDTGTGAPESGDGVLQRIAIQTETGVAAGQVVLALANNAHLDTTGAAHIPTTTLFANIAINQACGALQTPAPTPSPTPLITPTPPLDTPTPVGQTPTPVGQTPTPVGQTPTPVRTASPVPGAGTATPAGAAGTRTATPAALPPTGTTGDGGGVSAPVVLGLSSLLVLAMALGGYELTRRLRRQA